MQIKSLLVFASLPVVLFAQTTPAEIERELSNVFAPALVADLDAVDAFPINGGTLDEAMAIHNADTDLNTILLTIASDIQTAACPLSDSDASAILSLLEAQGPNIQQVSEGLIAREPGLNAVGAVPIIQQDIEILQASSDALVAAFIGCVSVRPSLDFFAQTINIDQSNVAPDVQAFQSAIDAAFAPVVAAFN